jgi:hypothetical protein
MTDRGDAEILEIIGGQARQQLGTDVVLPEGGRVSLEIQRPQPLDDLHRRLLRRHISG